MDALVLREDDGKTTAAVEQWDSSKLPEGDVLVKVRYSTINYKDALAVTGQGKIVREFPFIPGIDFAGVVEESSHEDFTAGSEVVLTGWGVGERHFGGLAEYARVKSKWLLPLPSNLSLLSAMQMGTAGLTAALSVQRLLDAGLKPDSGPVVVSGASGGVGSFATLLLAKLGFEVHAISRPSASEYLQQIGASAVLNRTDFADKPRPLDKSIWAGGVDTVGSNTLAHILSKSNYGATIACCGLAGGFDLPTTVMPFILRGVSLAGVDSVYAPITVRKKAWQLLAEQLTAEEVSSIGSQQITLDQVPDFCSALLSGQHKGRAVVAVS